MDFDSSICERYRMIGTCWTIQTEVAHTHTVKQVSESTRENGYGWCCAMKDRSTAGMEVISSAISWLPSTVYTSLRALFLSLSEYIYVTFFLGDMLMKLIATVASETYIFRGEGRKWSNEVHGGALLIPLASAVDPLFFQIGKTLLRKR
jgi:hypothetical protein